MARKFIQSMTSSLQHKLTKRLIKRIKPNHENSMRFVFLASFQLYEELGSLEPVRQFLVPHKALIA